MITDNFTDVTKLTDRAKRTAGLRLAAYRPADTLKRGKDPHGYPLWNSDPTSYYSW